MKKTLLFVGASFFVISCNDTKPAVSDAEVSAEKMKSKVQVEEILFEEPKTNIVDEVELNKKKIARQIHSGCVLEPGCLDSVSLDLPVPFKDSNRSKFDQNTEDVVEFPEVDAQFPGGVGEMKKFINQNIVYPVGNSDVQGVAYVSFVVDKHGAIKDAEVVRGFEKEFDQEALRLIRSMPNWIPAQNNGKVVATKLRLPIRFRLN